MINKREKILISACLVGVPCRYDGRDKLNKIVLEILSHSEAIIVCPELLVGFKIPRSSCNIIGGTGKDVLNNKAKIIGKDGLDYTDMFISGAKKALKIALDNNVTKAYLRDKSPSCGVGRLFNDNGEGFKIGNGIFAELLEENGIEIIRVES